MELFPKTPEEKAAFVPGGPLYINVKNANTMRLHDANVDGEAIKEKNRRLGELFMTGAWASSQSSETPA